MLVQARNAAEKINSDAEQQVAALNAALDATKPYQLQQMDQAVRGRAVGAACVSSDVKDIRDIVPRYRYQAR